jgi:hypothetical protein
MAAKAPWNRSWTSSSDAVSAAAAAARSGSSADDAAATGTDDATKRHANAATAKRSGEWPWGTTVEASATVLPMRTVVGPYPTRGPEVTECSGILISRRALGERAVAPVAWVAGSRV